MSNKRILNKVNEIEAQYIKLEELKKLSGNYRKVENDIHSLEYSITENTNILNSLYPEVFEMFIEKEQVFEYIRDDLNNQ